MGSREVVASHVWDGLCQLHLKKSVLKKFVLKKLCSECADREGASDRSTIQRVFSRVLGKIP